MSRVMEVNPQYAFLKFLSASVLLWCYSTPQGLAVNSKINMVMIVVPELGGSS